MLETTLVERELDQALECNSEKRLSKRTIEQLVAKIA